MKEAKLPLSSRPLVFVSCGQVSSEEKRLGSAVCELTEQLVECDVFYAEPVHDLLGLSRTILGNLGKCAGFIPIMHHRGTVHGLDDHKHIRASVWIEQEIAVAAFIQEVLSKKILVAPFVQKGIHREGLRELLHLNTFVFDQDEDILIQLRTLLPTWKHELRAVETNSVNLWLEANDYETIRVEIDYSPDGRVPQPTTVNVRSVVLKIFNHGDPFIIKSIKLEVRSSGRNVTTNDRTAVRKEDLITRDLTKEFLQLLSEATPPARWTLFGKSEEVEVHVITSLRNHKITYTASYVEEGFPKIKLTET